MILFYRVSYPYDDDKTHSYPWKDGKLHTLSKVIKIKNGDKKIRNGDIVNIHWKNRHGYKSWASQSLFSCAKCTCPNVFWSWGKVEDVDMPGGPFEIVIVDSGIVPESNLWASKSDKPRPPDIDILRKI